jgi:SAM-dependent methyltransferase
MCIVIPRYYVVAESEHELQNPISEEKLGLLGRRLGLDEGARVLDVASGRGGPALVLARAFGCTVDGIEIEPAFRAVAESRAADVGLSERVSFQLADASQVALPEAAYDAALCLGASFVYGGLADTVAALVPAVRPGGHVAVGEPYWRRLPLPTDYEEREEPFTTLEGTVTVFESEGVPVVSVIASSDDDWDRYETLHWQSVERWLAENVDDPDAAEIRTRHERYKRTYLRYGRDYLGWAVFVGWKRFANYVPSSRRST